MDSSQSTYRGNRNLVMPGSSSLPVPMSGKVTITRGLLLQWARNTRVLRVLPVLKLLRMAEDRAFADSCGGCNSRQGKSTMDSRDFEEILRVLGECREDYANRIKEAAGISGYTVVWHDLSGVRKETTK
jgi:hypothetical protein